MMKKVLILMFSFFCVTAFAEEFIKRAELFISGDPVLVHELEYNETTRKWFGDLVLSPEKLKTDNFSFDIRLILENDETIFLTPDKKVTVGQSGDRYFLFTETGREQLIFSLKQNGRFLIDVEFFKNDNDKIKSKFRIIQLDESLL